MRSLLTVVAVSALLAACGQPGDGDQALADANASGNQAAAALENAALSAPGTPLQKDQALALMKLRHDNYEKIGDSMKLLSRELNGQSPNLGSVREQAATIAKLAPQVPTWFPAGTGPDVGKTHAKAEIWQKPEDFSTKALGFAHAAVAFQTAAQGEDLAAIRAAHANLGKSCKACHDVYRAKVD